MFNGLATQSSKPGRVLYEGFLEGVARLAARHYKYSPHKSGELEREQMGLDC